MIMPTKCKSCGVETNLEATFFKRHKSFSRTVQTYCPQCWLKQQQSDAKRGLWWNCSLGALGIFLWIVWPEFSLGRVLVNLFVFQIFLILTILPHELGHAWMARLLGMRVFKLYIGSGKTVFRKRLFGFDSEIKAVPMGGLVFACHRDLAYIRSKQIAFVLAGPAINLVLAAVISPFLNPDDLWSFKPFEQELQIGLLFFYANLIVLLVNLWPRNVATGFGTFPSDGKQLFLTFFMSEEQRKLSHSASFVMEASIYYEQGDYLSAQSWVEKGLALYPGNETLLNWHGVVALGLGDYGNARECFLNLLQRESKEPLMRPLLMNNIAYANALLGGDELLKEADEFSSEAMTAMSWMPAIRGTRGTVLAAMGRVAEALPLLHDSMLQAEIAGHKAQNACVIAEAEWRRGNLDAARIYLEEARKLDPQCSLLIRVEKVIRSDPQMDTNSTMTTT